MKIRKIFGGILRLLLGIVIIVGVFYFTADYDEEIVCAFFLLIALGIVLFISYMLGAAIIGFFGKGKDDYL